MDKIQPGNPELIYQIRLEKIALKRCIFKVDYIEQDSTAPT